ncbi:MAG TPA: hypothetical protein VIJ29_01945 [Candidatus Paceibacterota bacterium]
MNKESASGWAEQLWEAGSLTDADWLFLERLFARRRGWPRKLIDDLRKSGNRLPKTSWGVGGKAKLIRAMNAANLKLGANYCSYRIAVPRYSRNIQVLTLVKKNLCRTSQALRRASTLSAKGSFSKMIPCRSSYARRRQLLVLMRSAS